MDAEGVWADVGAKGTPRHVSWTFRTHNLEAWIRKPNMDDEAHIVAAGVDPATKRIKSFRACLQEFVGRCVVRTNFGLTAAHLDDKDVKRDTDFLWSLYLNLGVADALPNEGRVDLVEAVQGKRIGSSTEKPGTQSPKPESYGATSDEEE